MTSGRATIAAGGVASLAAVTATFGLANLVGHQLGFDLWPMALSGAVKDIEVPAQSPNGPGVNPLIAARNPLAASPLTRGAAGGAFGPGTGAGPGLALPAPIGFPGATVPGVGVTVRPGATIAPSNPGLRREGRRGDRGSAGGTPSDSTSATPIVTPAAVTPAPAPAATPSPANNVNVSASPSPTSSVTSREGSSKSGAAGNGNTSSAGQSKKQSAVSSTGRGNGNSSRSGGRPSTPPGQAKKQQGTVAQVSGRSGAQQPAAASSPEPVPPVSGGQGTGSGEQSGDGDGRTPSAPPGQGKD